MKIQEVILYIVFQVILGKVMVKFLFIKGLCMVALACHLDFFFHLVTIEKVGMITLWKVSKYPNMEFFLVRIFLY